MAICKKCNASFPSILELNGKEYCLRKRKYCYECSPLRKDTSYNLDMSKPVSTCRNCNKKFNSKRNRSCCNSCNANKQKYSKKEKALQYLGGKCFKCNYSRCPAALTFHHKDPKTKLFSISGNHTRKWEDIQKELDKCILLCHNCHTELHYIEKHGITWITEYNLPTKLLPKDFPVINVYRRLKEPKIIKKKIDKPKKSRRKVLIRPNKPQLLHEIEKLGYCGAGRKYGVSDNAIRKWLKSMGD